MDYDTESCWKNAACSISDFISCASLLLNAGFALKDFQEWIGQPILRGWLTFTGTWTRPGSRARRKNAPEASSSDVRNVLEKSGQIKAGTKRKSPETLRFQDFFCTEGPYRGIAFVLKVQYNLSTPARRERFARETAFLKEETHPAILRHFDDGDYRLPDGRIYPFVITNYCPQNLEKLIAQGNISFPSKVLYACQLLSALQLLQKKNIIHRDIKPNNIFINGSDAVLGDFGLIKVLNPIEEAGLADDDDIQMINDTAFHAADGYTAMPYYYRTPELVAYANKKDVLHIESDVFQLGLVFAKLFTGENPLVESADIKAPIQLKKIGRVVDTEDGGLVFNSQYVNIRLQTTG